MHCCCCHTAAPLQNILLLVYDVAVSLILLFLLVWGYFQCWYQIQWPRLQPKMLCSMSIAAPPCCDASCSASMLPCLPLLQPRDQRHSIASCCSSHKHCLLLQIQKLYICLCRFAANEAASVCRNYHCFVLLPVLLLLLLLLLLVLNPFSLLLPSGAPLPSMGRLLLSTPAPLLLPDPNHSCLAEPS